MKSYTDLGQSKKLAEILPFPYNTADNTWERVKIGVPEEQQYVHDANMPFCFYSGIGVPCWSLAALLDVLPSSTLDSSDDHHYRLHCMERFTEWYDNPVDACVEMILKLNDKNGIFI